MAQPFPCNGDVLGGLAHHISDPSSVGLFGLESYNKAMIQEEGSEKMYGSLKNFALSQLTSLSHASNFNGGVGIVTASVNSPPAEARSMFHIPNGVDHWAYSSGSVLCFEQGEQNSHTDYPKIGHEDDYSTWADSMDHNYQWNHLNSKCAINSRLIDDANCFETASSYYAMDNTNKDNRHGEEQFSLVYSDSIEADDLQEFGGLEGCFNKRPNMGGEMQASKKQYVGAPKKPKPNPIPSKDPQSVAAKNRRERISERLRVLQDLVPNGSKVDLVTMLEKAISYVKFLQLQVKVLAADEFWPAQNGKAPEVGQVKEAIDAILCSHKRREGSSKSEFNKKK